jgi:hypothetical protein
VQSDAIYQFAGVRGDGPDLALIHLPKPFPGIWIGYRLPFYQGSPDSLTGLTVAKYGRGFSSFSEQNPASGGAVIPEGFGTFRAADLKVDRVAGGEIRYLPNHAGQLTMPGDSGGPAFVWDRGVALLAGITSTGSWDCFKNVGATPAQIDANCRNSIFQLEQAHDVAIPSVRRSIEAVLKTQWHPTATSEPVWIHRPEIETSVWAISDVNKATWAQAARLAAKLCYNRGFVAGHFDGHQNLAAGEYGIQCAGRGATFYDVTQPQIASTGWGFTDVNQVNWAQANRAAERLCAGANLGYVGGHFNGQMANGKYGIFCYKDNAQWFDALGTDIANTGWGFRGKLDNENWAQAARAAVGYCRARGFSGGFMNGHEVPGKYGVVCQK